MSTKMTNIVRVTTQLLWSLKNGLHKDNLMNLKNHTHIYNMFQHNYTHIFRNPAVDNCI